MESERNVFLDYIIHDRLKHIKEIIEEPRESRSGGIPRPSEKEYESGYMTINIIIKPSDCEEEYLWAGVAD